MQHSVQCDRCRGPLTGAQSGAVLARVVLAIGLVAGGSCFMLQAFERKMTYYPTSEPEATPHSVGLRYEDVWLRASDGVRLHGWYVPGSEGAAALLFLHGNAGNISHRVDNLQRLHEIGLNVFILDYRGYGGSEGKPSEKGLYLDAAAAYEYLEGRVDKAGHDIVVFGRSLGGAVAVELCTQVDCERLILESTFSSAADMAKVIFPLLPVGPFLRERFDSLGKMGKVRARLLQFHGTEDDTVPITLGQKLFQAAPGPKEFIPIPGAGHNDTYEVGGEAYFEKIREFADEEVDSS